MMPTPNFAFQLFARHYLHAKGGIVVEVQIDFSIVMKKCEWLRHVEKERKRKKIKKNEEIQNMDLSNDKSWNTNNMKSHQRKIKC